MYNGQASTKGAQGTQTEGIMKTMFKGLVALTLAASALHGNAAPTQGSEKQAPAMRIDLTARPDVKPLWKTATQVAQTYPDCPTMMGNYCPTVGARARCYWYAYQEPMVCICRPGNVWECQ